MAGKGSQAIKGKDLGDRLNLDEAIKSIAAMRSGSYEHKSFTLAGDVDNQELAAITPDAPNDGSRLFTKFKRAHFVVIRASADIRVKFNSTDNDEIPVRFLEGGFLEELVLEVEKIFISHDVGVTVDVRIS